MTKQNIISLSGSKVKDIDTDLFSGNIRDDIVQRIIEVEKYYEKQPYSHTLWAGMMTSASGNVKHNRHVWKTDRGKGLARVPKKRMSDKGDRFSWVAAVTPGTRGGRKAHGPKLERANLRYNRKEFVMGLLSCLAKSSSEKALSEKYSSLANQKISLKLPLIIDLKSIPAKTKDFYSSLLKLLGESVFSIAVKERVQRAGIGKTRGRRYKSNAGLLLVVGNKENPRITGVDVVSAKNLKLMDFGVSGRLSLFTEEAVKDLETRIGGKK